jgi:hypothetical protein
VYASPKKNSIATMRLKFLLRQAHQLRFARRIARQTLASDHAIIDARATPRIAPTCATLRATRLSAHRNVTVVSRRASRSARRHACRRRLSVANARHR